MTKYTIDHVNEEITVIKSFAKAAGIVGSPDYSKQHLATSNMKDGQEVRELFIIRAVPTFFRSIQKTSKPLPAGFYTPLYPLL